jgi:thiamine-monophosphate kinase
VSLHGDPTPVTLQAWASSGLIRRIRARGRARPPGTGVLTGIGDDTAVLAVSPGASLLATTDLLVEGRSLPARDGGSRRHRWKAMMVNVSDIAAMGGEPRYALVGLAVPGATPPDDVEAFYEGMSEAGGGARRGDRRRRHLLVAARLVRRRHAARRAHGRAAPSLRGRGRATPSPSPARSAIPPRASRCSRAGAAAVASEPSRDLVRAHLRPCARVAEGRWLGRAARRAAR